jgi:hypothetical protein
MVLEYPSVARIVPRTDDMYKICCIRLDGDFDILPEVYKSTTRRHRCSICSDPFLRLIGIDEIRHLFVKPIHESQCHLLVEIEGRIRIVDDERTKKTVGVLALVVRMVPVRARSVCLRRKNELIPPEDDAKLAINS